MKRRWLKQSWQSPTKDDEERSPCTPPVHALLASTVLLLAAVQLSRAAVQLAQLSLDALRR